MPDYACYYDKATHCGFPDNMERQKEECKKGFEPNSHLKRCMYQRSDGTCDNVSACHHARTGND